MVKIQKLGKKGDSYLEGNLVYIILFILFLVAGMAFIYKYENNVYFWEQYYSYTISKVINSAEVGDRIELNVDKAVELSRKDGIARASGIFSFDNTRKEVIVSLQKGKKTFYPFLRNYNIDEIIVDDSIKGFVLKFKVNKGDTN